MKDNIRKKLKENIIVFSDLDGTALLSSHKFSQKTKDIVKKVYKSGHYFIPITARSTLDTFEHQALYLGLDKLGGIAVANNGTHIYDFKKNHWIRQAYVSQTMVERVFRHTYGKVGKYKVHYFADNTTYVYGAGENSRYWSDIMNMDYKVVTEFGEITEPINHMTIVLKKGVSEQEIKAFYQEFEFVNEELSAIRYYDRVHELTPKGINKGEALQLILDYLNLNEQNTSVFCFGDSVNDIPMFEAAQYPVAMGNAIDQLFEDAAYITKTNDENGVADFIEKYIL
ncbi:HAD superfamily hydrolase [Spiroplasma clarkii]|uniref:HAD superfamily hydrolase n=1 Tax=Spiroplasma clarkii TaxID=2139 RepID=A0A1Y0L2K3_9MOLU|nr:Cof-type HAD-IIB family hydrolase [Spiroplasma clarkii]ARU92223.1 HAD superfamily hydrolase [Spiroplasma clarkii]ATX71545.1 HAD superfamily hydrolase [Spiroplasma clarkii]